MKAKLIFDWLMKLVLRFDMEILDVGRFHKMIQEFFEFKGSGIFFWNVMIAIVLVSKIFAV